MWPDETMTQLKHSFVKYTLTAHGQHVAIRNHDSTQTQVKHTLAAHRQHVAIRNQGPWIEK